LTKAERLALEQERLKEMKGFDEEVTGGAIAAGIDEVGRGPLAGPVVAAAVILPADFDVPGINDSKKLSEKKREALYDEITQKALAWSVAFVDNRVIDEINILQATKKAMVESVNNLSTKPEALIIDAVQLQDVEIKQHSVIKGDEKSLSVAAASIVAKVTRDRYMVEMAEKYPGYAFEKNKGYGTAAHYQGLRENGISEIHRKSFLKNFDVD